MDYRIYPKNYPNRDGRFGVYDGAYLTPELIPALEEIVDAYQTICHSSRFINELRKIRREFQERLAPVYYCGRLFKEIGNCQICLKRGDLNHTGAHKLNRCMGEGLLAKFMGKERLITETGAGQRGVVLVTATAFFGLECEIHMGEMDITKQAPDVTRMKILGAKAVPVTHGPETLKKTMDSAFESYTKDHKDPIYCIGSALGPHPFPLMVRDFQSVVGYGARDQLYETAGMFLDEVYACVGGGSGPIGMFIPFLDGPVSVTGVEPPGRGEHLGDHVASVKFDERGVMHGSESIMLKDENGEPAPVCSIASGLDCPSVGLEHASPHGLGRVKYDTASDEEAMDVFFKLFRYEGVIPAIESVCAVAYTIRRAREVRQGVILVYLGGRGNKDINYMVEYYGYGEQSMD